MSEAQRSPEELAAAVVEAASKVSYHNATDDINCWRRETAARQAAERELAKLSDEAIARGIYVDLRNYLTYDTARKFEAIRPADQKPAEGSFYSIVNKVAGV